MWLYSQKPRKREAEMNEQETLSICIMEIPKSQRVIKKISFLISKHSNPLQTGRQSVRELSGYSQPSNQDTESIIAVYAPTIDATWSEKDEFYQQLEQKYSNLSQQREMLLMKYISERIREAT